MSAVMGLLPILQIDWNAKHEKDGSLLDIARKEGHTDIADWLTVITAVEIKTEDDISNIRTEMRKKQLLSRSDHINMLTDRLDNLVKQDEETKFNKCLREILRLKSCDSFKTLFNEFSSTSDMEKDIALMIINQICPTE